MRRQSMFIIMSVKKGGYKQCVWNNRKGGEKTMCVHVCVCTRVCMCEQVCVRVCVLWVISILLFLFSELKK